MGSLLRAALILTAALGLSACRSDRPMTPEEHMEKMADDPTQVVDQKIKGFQVIWTRGGKLGYLKTYDVSMAEETPVEMHYIEDLDFRTRGWVANDGQGVRFEYPADKVRETRRQPFEKIDLPLDTVENQIRRILGVDPQTPLALRRAEASDLERK